MTKVCFINIYQGASLRGAETFVSQVSERLKKHYDVTIISGNKTLPDRWPFLWRTFLDPQGFLILIYTTLLLPKIWREKYDVIIPVNGGWMPAVIRIATWLYGGKMLISGQAGMGWDERNNLWCFPDTFVALSQVSQKWAVRVNPFITSIKIPNGVDTRKFSARGDKIKVALKSPMVLCVAALTKDKRIDLVIWAVSKLKDFSLLLVGGAGESQGKIISLGKKLLGKRFLYKNFPYAKMPGVFRASDVFTLVSEPYFSFEIAIVEAMSTGLPVVVNDDSIRREIVGDAGYYVDPKDVVNYAKTLKVAYINSKATKMLVLERAKMFDWQSVSAKYVDLIESLTHG